MIRYAKPRTIDQALALLSEGGWRMLAGGTDFYPALGSSPLRRDVLDLNGLAEMRGISLGPEALVIGARTTWSDIVRADLPPACDALKQAAREVGAIQIQNAGTVGGNLCNASPAADGVPPLLALDAEVALRSARGARNLPLADFITGYRQTALAGDELLTAVRIPARACAGRSAFLKLGARRYLVISIAMAAVRLAFGADGAIREAAVSIGACSPVARRLGDLERRLVGLASAEAVADIVAAADFGGLAPIDDVRASAGYREQAAREIVQRALTGLLAEPQRAAA